MKWKIILFYEQATKSSKARRKLCKMRQRRHDDDNNNNSNTDNERETKIKYWMKDSEWQIQTPMLLYGGLIAT